MNIRNLFSIASLLLLASCGSGNEATDSSGVPQETETILPGKKLFINNCVQCHSVSKDKNAPALAGSMERWNNDTVKLVAYIKNSQEVIKTDPYAAKLYKDWSNMPMPPFPHLTEGEIKEILEYIGKGED
jgi:mono/diheme cytochrome c family protein